MKRFNLAPGNQKIYHPGIDPKSGHVAFAVYSASWMKTKTALRPTTDELYTYLLRLHIVPVFGSH